MTLAEYLDYCVKQSDPAFVPDHRVPQTIFWIVENDRAVGMLRVRRRLGDPRAGQSATNSINAVSVTISMSGITP
jgi:predicted acetyltransferase